MGIAFKNQWVCTRQHEFSIKKWPDGVVVFDDATGHLHALSVSAASVLELMQPGVPLDAFQLGWQLLEETPTEDDVEMVENVLTEFSSLNLIQRVAV